MSLVETDDRGAGGTPTPLPEVVFDRVYEPSKGLSLPSIRQIVSYQDLLYFLARRDVALRYKQTLIGLAWTVLQPALASVDYEAPADSGFIRSAVAEASR